MKQLELHTKSLEKWNRDYDEELFRSFDEEKAVRFADSGGRKIQMPVEVKPGAVVTLSDTMKMYYQPQIHADTTRAMLKYKDHMVQREMSKQAWQDQQMMAATHKQMMEQMSWKLAQKEIMEKTQAKIYTPTSLGYGQVETPATLATYRTGLGLTEKQLESLSDYLSK